MPLPKRRMAEVGRCDTFRYVPEAHRVSWAYQVVAALRVQNASGWTGEEARKETWGDRYQAALRSYPGIRPWEDLKGMAATKEAVTSRRAAAIWALQHVSPRLPKDVVRLIAKQADYTPLPVNPDAIIATTSAYRNTRLDAVRGRVHCYAKLLTNYQLAYLSAESSRLSTPIFAELLYFDSLHTSKSREGQIRAAIVLWIVSDIPTGDGIPHTNKALEQWMTPYLGSVNQIWNKLLTHIEGQLPWWMRIRTPWTHPGKDSLGPTWFTGKPKYSPTVSGWVHPETRSYFDCYRSIYPHSAFSIESSGPLGGSVRGDSGHRFVVPSPFRDM